MANRKVIFLAPETSRTQAQVLYTAATFGTVPQPSLVVGEETEKTWFASYAASVGDARINTLKNGVDGVPGARLYIIGRAAPDTGKLLETNSPTAQDRIGTAFPDSDALADNNLSVAQQ